MIRHTTVTKFRLNSRPKLKLIMSKFRYTSGIVNSLTDSVKYGIGGMISESKPVSRAPENIPTTINRTSKRPR
jgi:hypothetical protein